MVRKGIQLRRRSNFKGWRPALDQYGNPTVYQHCIRRLLILNRVCSADSLEKILAAAASKHGCSARHRLWFVPSQQLKCLRSRRRRTQNPQMRKELSLQIRTCHKKELRQWKSEPVFWRFLAGGRTYNISCPKVLAALISFVLMKMILLACWQNFSMVHVKCHFHQQCFQNRFGPFKKWKLLFGDKKMVKVGVKLGWQQNC